VGHDRHQGPDGGPDGEPELPVQLVQAFATFGPAYTKWLHLRLRESGLSYARLRLLGALHYDSPRIMSDVSDELGVTPRNVTALVDGLAQEGLVRRRPHPTDRRATIIELTARGRELGSGMYAEHLDAAATLFATLSPDDQRTLLRLVDHLYRAIRVDRDGERPRARP